MSLEKHRMPTFVPVVLGLLGIGGAAWGILALAGALSKLQPQLPNVIAAIVILVLDAFAAYCGVRALQRAPGWLRLNRILWAMQVPLVFSPLVSYFFATGGFVAVSVRLWPPLHFNWQAWLGTSHTLQLLTPGPFILGVNLLALGIAWYLFRAVEEPSPSGHAPA